MLDWMFILLFILAVLFMFFAVGNEDHAYWNMISTLLSAVLWLILSLSQMVIEIPYQAITSSDTIVTGVHEYTSPISPFLTYLFLALFFINFIYLLAMVWDNWYNYKNWHGGN